MIISNHTITKDTGTLVLTSPVFLSNWGFDLVSEHVADQRSDLKVCCRP